MSRIRRSSDGETTDLRRSFRRWRDDFHSNIWRRPAWRRMILPDFLISNRFAAAFLVFIFGMLFFYRRKHQMQVLSLQLGRGICLRHLLDRFEHAVEHSSSQVDMGHFPAPEHNDDLDLVALVDQLFGLGDPDIKIMQRDLRR
jgi:hypothetical protein